MGFKVNWLIILSIITFFYSQAEAVNIHVMDGGCTLRDAIRAANADASRGDCPAGSGNDTIILADTFSLQLSQELPTINTPISIRTATASGQAIIDGNNTYRCLRIQDTLNVSLENITIINGKTSQSATIVDQSQTGSGILLQSSELTLENVQIIDNNADAGFGAGIAAYSSTLTMDKTDFIGNKFNSFGGIYGLGAHIYLRDSQATISHSTFANFTVYPRVVAANGGAIFIAGSQVSINASTFKNIPTDSYGAAIAIQDLLIDPVGPGTGTYNDAGLTIRNSTFYNSQAWYTGQITLAAIAAGKESTDKTVDVTVRNVTFFKTGQDLAVTPDPESVNQLLIYSGVDFYAYNSLFVFGQEYAGCFANLDDANWLMDINNSFPDDSCSYTSQNGNPTTQYTLYGILQDNGGLTETVKLRPLDYSFTPAIENLAFNAGDSATCELYDQRGVLRQMPCEQGAYEVDDVADIGVDMQLITPGPYYVGQNLEYQININNNGPAFAFGIELSLASNSLSVTGFNSVYSCASLMCQILFIPNGSQANLTMYAQINNVQNFDISANVSFISNSILDQNIGNNTDATDNGGATVNAADLKITQVLNTTPPYFVGQQLNYAITVTNQGPNAVQNVSITHPSLVGLSAVNHSSCDGSSATICLINTLNNGNSRTIFFTAEVTANKIENESEVSSSLLDPNLSNNQVVNKNNVQVASNLRVAVNKITSAPHFQAQSLQFAVVIKNSGPDQATNVTINNVFENMAVIGVSNQCIDGVVPCVVASLDVNEVIEILYTTTLFTEDFSVDTLVTADQNDSDLSNNGGGFSGSIVNDADVSIGINVLSQPPYYNNSIIDLQLRVANLGSREASDVLIDAADLTNLQILSVYSENCMDLPCTIATMNDNLNSVETLNIQAFIVNIGDFSLTATATANEFDPIISSNQSSFTLTAVQNPLDLIFMGGFEN